ncbi:hypothetical protein EXIGLDRAFT_317908 [Exidia glandulosa HHB12029]|uniref:Uncharacterized protein n=1 Tax=Exidia glandulosa HHB12029 TaxID=1314781 RepID=A0A165Q1Q1_EXIGL|nr:hypothetical protein EXIGLDRAFT_317908 [Exidia glandulosa HHB12029]
MRRLQTDSIHYLDYPSWRRERGRLRNARVVRLTLREVWTTFSTTLYSVPRGRVPNSLSQRARNASSTTTQWRRLAPTRPNRSGTARAPGGLDGARSDWSAQCRAGDVVWTGRATRHKTRQPAHASSPRRSATQRDQRTEHHRSRLGRRLRSDHDVSHARTHERSDARAPRRQTRRQREYERRPQCRTRHGRRTRRTGRTQGRRRVYV